MKAENLQEEVKMALEADYSLGTDATDKLPYAPKSIGKIQSQNNLPAFEGGESIQNSKTLIRKTSSEDNLLDFDHVSTLLNKSIQVNQNIIPDLLDIKQ